MGLQITPLNISTKIGTLTSAIFLKMTIKLCSSPSSIQQRWQSSDLKWSNKAVFRFKYILNASRLVANNSLPLHQT
jgi:hypothetical protein